MLSEQCFWWDLLNCFLFYFLNVISNFDGGHLRLFKLLRSNLIKGKRISPTYFTEFIHLVRLAALRIKPVYFQAVRFYLKIGSDPDRLFGHLKFIEHHFARNWHFISALFDIILNVKVWNLNTWRIVDSLLAEKGPPLIKCNYVAALTLFSELTENKMFDLFLDAHNCHKNFLHSFVSIRKSLIEPFLEKLVPVYTQRFDSRISYGKYLSCLLLHLLDGHKYQSQVFPEFINVLFLHHECEILAHLKHGIVMNVACFHLQRPCCHESK